MNDSRDVPAAHSMDTAWFAVDSDGHVAVFDSGEAGAAPSKAYLGEDHYVLLKKLRETLPRSGSVIERAAYRASGAAEHVTPRGAWGLLMFLRSVEEVHDLLDKVGAQRIDVSEGEGVLIPDNYRNAETIAAVHSRGACLGCYFGRLGEDDIESVADHGLYVYRHEDDGIAGAYVPAAVPKKPISAKELPQEVAENTIVYEGRFAERASVQPAAIWASESWGPAWLSLDGKTVRPFPGREGELDPAIAEEADGREVVVREALILPEGELLVPKREKRPEPEYEELHLSEPDAVASPRPPAAPKKRPWWKLW